jgi:hypothetical protein
MSRNANYRPGKAACWRRSDKVPYIQWSYLLANSYWPRQHVAVIALHAKATEGPWFNSRQAQQIFSCREHPDGLCDSPSPLICECVRNFFLFFFILLLLLLLLLHSPLFATDPSKLIRSPMSWWPQSCQVTGTAKGYNQLLHMHVAMQLAL